MSKALNYKLFLAILFAFFILVQAYHAYFFPIRYDDGFFSTVAKSVAFGNGYKATIYDKSSLFHPWVTTGPVMILPAALFIKIFGNSYSIVKISSILMVNILLLINYRFLKKYYSKSLNINKFIFIFFALSVIFSLADYNPEHLTPFALWYLLMGDVPSGILAFLATIILINEEKNSAFYSGIIIGFAVLCKVLASFVLIAAILFLIYRKKFKDIIFILLGFIIPILGFEIYKISSFASFSEYTNNKMLFLKNLLARATSSNSSGISEMLNNASMQFSGLTSGLGFISRASIPVSVYFLVKNLKNTSDIKQKNMILLTSIILLMFAGWFIFLAQNLFRYLIIPLFFVAFLYAMFFSQKNLQYNLKTFKNIKLFLAIFLLEKLIFTCFIYHYHESTGKHGESYRKASKNILKLVKKYKKEGYEIYSCGSFSTIEFLLNSTNNFKNCIDFDKNSASKALYFEEFYSYGMYIITTNGKDAFVKLPDTKFEKNCNGKENYRDKLYLLKECQ
jgi:hypothetical protein